MNEIIRLPDARYDRHGVLQPITWKARTWLYQNTKVKLLVNSAAEMPANLLASDDVIEMMRDDGLVIRLRQPAPHRP
jgi:hypothetical protein